MNISLSLPKIFHVFLAKWDLRRINSFRQNVKKAESDAGVFVLNVFLRLKLESTEKRSEISLTTTGFRTKLRDEKIITVKDDDISVKRIGIQVLVELQQRAYLTENLPW